MNIETSAAKNLFNSLKKVSDLSNLVDEGQTESVILECKEISMNSASLNSSMKVHLAKTISAFSNTEGGLIIFGIKTVNKEKRDYLNDLVPIGNVDNFREKLANLYPQLITPFVKPDFKIIKEPRKQSGYLLMYIPVIDGDPIRSHEDNHFYFRNGEQSLEMSYEQIKRMFMGTSSPNLGVIFPDRLIKELSSGIWEVKVAASNRNNNPAKTASISIEILNPRNFSSISGHSGFRDTSDINEGSRIFMVDLGRPIYKNLDVVVGSINVEPQPRKKLIKIEAKTYAENMVSIVQTFNIILGKKPRITLVNESLNY